jgi:7-cyano-7-deazaguanosine (preQ0) biosynthesis protein QueE
VTADDGHELVVSEVFGPTFQGEGPTLGRRAAFVRLGRCNLDCSWCDTPYTWDWDRYDPAVELSRRSVDEVVADVEGRGVDRVVVTGGEPLLQQRRLVPFLEAAAERGWAVEVETNGTVVPSPEVASRVERFTVSPKLANSGVDPARAIDPDALRAFAALPPGRAAFKFVVAAEGDLDEVAAVVEAHGIDPATVFVMPEGTTPEVVVGTARAVAHAVTERGWHLTTRLHVLLWGDERGR